MGPALSVLVREMYIVWTVKDNDERMARNNLLCVHFTKVSRF